VGLLHSRFPFFRRQELETDWLERLGKNRANDGMGTILVATQVVEQSVDIDLDFIVSDLAPTDMLLQRMGRLWRHQREDRLAGLPEFWINTPRLAPDASVRELKKALGKSGFVYAPYVLLRSAQVFSTLGEINLPGQIREVLEATYAPCAHEADSWVTLRNEVEKTREDLASLATALTRVLIHPPTDDKEHMLTRRQGAPTCPVVLLQSCEPVGRDTWRLTGVCGDTAEVSGYKWSIDAARLLYRNLVLAPLYSIPRQASPRWLSLHVRGPAVWAIVSPDGSCECPESETATNFSYHPMLGLHTKPASPTQPSSYREDDDDEFDS
jgi:CRISPR-associated endonuclease/helicase Cas3